MCLTTYLQGYLLCRRVSPVPDIWCLRVVHFGKLGSLSLRTTLFEVFIKVERKSKDPPLKVADGDEDLITLDAPTRINPVNPTA